MAAKVKCEGDLDFEYDDERWSLKRWDHPNVAYKNGIMRLQETGAVDFVGLHNKRDLYLFEVKDYRGHRRMKPQPLWQEFGCKVRDTIAGLIGACRQDHHQDEWFPFVEALSRPRSTIFAILWAEAPPEGIAATQEGLRSRLKWLRCQAHVVNSKHQGRIRIPDMQVSFNPRHRFKSPVP